MAQRITSGNKRYGYVRDESCDFQRDVDATFSKAAPEAIGNPTPSNWPHNEKSDPIYDHLKGIREGREQKDGSVC